MRNEAQYAAARAEANIAFVVAIRQGRLSSNENADNFAGLYMYMGRQNGRDLFKHSLTRQYLA